MCLECLWVIESKESRQQHDWWAVTGCGCNSSNDYANLDTHETIKEPVISEYFIDRTVNKNAQFNIYSTATGSTKTATVSKEHVILEGGRTTKTEKNTQQKIKPLHFNTGTQNQAYLITF